MMTSERWQQLDNLLQAALEHAPHERAAFLNAACAGDVELLKEVESLLASNQEMKDFLASPAAQDAAILLANENDNSILRQPIAHYSLRQLLGSGGMGEVYLAEDTRLGRKVALKLLPPFFTLDEERVTRFHREARSASALNHPNIVTIYELGQSDGRHFIATEYIEGETVRSLMDKGEMKLGQMLDITMQTAGALAAAHAAGIVHRDIKPENLMVRPDGFVKVLDFGLAKLTETQTSKKPAGAAALEKVRTQPGTVMGTTRYMSPEQARGQSVDARTDIFSLGVVLYEMVNGRAPFDGETNSDVIAAILEKQPLPSKPDSPAQLQWIIGKALRKDKDDRYQTLKEMLSDLKHVQHELEGRALSSAEYLIGKIKRHKAIAAGALGALLLALAGIAYFHPRERAIESVAVLPFVNVSADPRTEYLSDGITESLIDALSRSSNLKVINRNSVFRYKVREPQSVDPDPREVGLALGVQAVLTGRIVQSADGLFISAELVDTRDNSHLWGEQYNSKKLSDIFAVQKEISRDIAQKLRLRLAGETGRGSEKRHTDNIKAFENYTMGRAYLHRRTREDLLNAVRYYENAIKEDNNYARAHAGLADAYANLTARGYMAPLEGRKKIREAAEKALALDENLAEAHIAQSLKYLAAPYDFPEGERELRRAIELNPNLGTAHLYMSLSLMRQGRFEEGLDEMLKAREVDPLSPIIGRQVSLSYHLKRDYVRALEVLKRANELGPPFSSTNEIGIYVQLRLFTEALEELDKAKRERKDDPILIYSAGILHAAQGKRPEALEVVKELERLSGTDLTQAQWIAKIYAALNEKDLSFAWLERGLAAGSIVSFYKDEPVWDTLRGDSRFPDLLRRMGIP